MQTSAQQTNELLVRRLGFWSSIGIVIGVTIGSGIFRTPATIATRVPDPALMLGVWLAGGLISLCGALLGRNTRGSTIVVGSLNLGGSIELLPNAVRIAELAIDKQAQTVLMPVAARRQLQDLPDDLWTKLNIEFYKDASDAVFKALVE